MTSEPDTPVGRGKPPVHGQFKKGHSGNPAGRPKRKRQSLDRQFNEALKESLHMRQNRLATSIASNCLVRVVQQLVLSAANGDPRAIQYLLKRTELCDASDALAEAASVPTAGAPDGEIKKSKTHQPPLQNEDMQSSQTVMEVDAATQVSETGKVTGNVTGNKTGNDAGLNSNDAVPAPDAPPPVPPRPKRPTIMIAGKVIQQGD